MIMHESLHGVACASMEASVAASSVRIRALVKWMRSVCLVIYYTLYCTRHLNGFVF